MRKLKINSLLFILCIFLWNACQNKPVISPSIVVKQTGDMTLFGHPTNLENIRAELMDSLLKMKTIPESMDINYEGEVLMGMRGEVNTEVTGAITNAKESKLNPVVVSRVYYKEKGTDCDQPDSSRTNCALISLQYPVVYYQESILPNNVNTWIHNYLKEILTASSEEENVSGLTLEDAAKVFFDIHEEFNESIMYGGFIAEGEYRVLVNDGKYLTLEMSSYSFQGGAHGNPAGLVATYDTQTGKKLGWDDLVIDKVAMQTMAEKQFRIEQEESFETGFEFDETFPFKLPDNFGLTEDGIYFNYLPYEVSPYYMGNTTFTIPFAEMGPNAKIQLTNEPSDSGGSQ